MADLAAEASTTDWLWQGYLARENITLLTSQWKTGKTTLLTALLAQLNTGGDLGGLQVMPGRAVVVSEEAPDLWAQRNLKLNLGNHSWLCRPFCCCLDQAAWAELVKKIAEEHAARPVDLIVIDPLSAFLPGNAEYAPQQLKPMLSILRGLADLGPSLLLLHHPPKGYTRAGQAARGSGLLSSFVDILIEMFPFKRADDADRRRRLQAYSRHDATPTQWVIELNAEGTNYAGHGDISNSDYLHEWPTVRRVLLEAKNKVTLKELLDAWPLDPPAPSYVTLWRWLDRAVREGLVLKRGSGHRDQPHRYWLPGQEEEWNKNPLYTPSVDEVMEMVENAWKEQENRGSQGPV
jgi:hypothetical protein